MRSTKSCYLKLLFDVPVESGNRGVEPPALDEDGAAPVLVQVYPGVGGQEGAGPPPQQAGPGRHLADARGLGQEEGPGVEGVPQPPLRRRGGSRLVGGLDVGGQGGVGGQGQVRD